jgi:hypothetical protein
MADPPRYPDTGDDSGDGQSARSAPRWLTVLGIAIAIALIVLFVVLHLTGTLGPGAH